MPTDPDADRDSERPSNAEQPARSERPRKKKARRAKQPEPIDETKINAPDKQTLGMLGVIAAVTLVLWALAHAACNYHPPRETRRPRVVKTEEYAREPKSAAVEAVHRLAMLDYTGALALAAGSFAEEIKKEQAACAADRAGCDARKLAAAEAQSAGVLLERDLGGAKVRVVTRGVGDTPKAVIVRAERDGGLWKATAKVADEPGANLPGPVMPPPPNPHGAFSPIPVQSAAGGAAPALKMVLKPRPAAPAPAPSAQ